MSAFETNFPVAQTFYVRVFDENIGRSASGVYLTKATVFFSKKDITGSVSIEVRVVDADTNNITNFILPRSKKVLYSSDVNVSTDGSLGTEFEFDTPIYLLGDKEYALIIKSDVPNYEVWTSQLGQKDIASGTQINKQPDTGIFFASSNGRTWEPYTDRDLKYKLHIAKFKHDSATIKLRNAKNEYFSTPTSRTGISARIGQDVEGSSIVELDLEIAGDSQFTNTQLIGSDQITYELVDPVAGANGIIVAKDPFGSNPKEFVIANLTLENKFQIANNVTLYINGIAEANTANILNITTPTGKLRAYDTSSLKKIVNFGITQISDSNGEWSAPSTGEYTFQEMKQYLRLQEDGIRSPVYGLLSPPIHKSVNLFSGLTPEGSSMNFTGQFAQAKIFNNYNLTGNYKLNLNVPTYFTREDVFVKSHSLEKSGSIASGSVQVTGNLNRDTNSFHGPALDTKRSAILATRYLINNDYTGEDGISGGDAWSKYVSKVVTLAEGQDAEDLRVYIDAYKPNGTNVKVYYKILHKEDDRAFEEDISWVEMTQEQNEFTYSKLEKLDDFIEYQFNIPTNKLTGTNNEVEYENTDTTPVITYTGFKRFKIKIVLLSAASRLYPRVKNIRSIALQI